MDIISWILSNSGTGGNVSTDASSLTSGTLADSRLSTNITKQGNVFNGANQLVKNDASGKIPVANMPIGIVNVVSVSNQAAKLALTKSSNLTLCLQATGETTALNQHEWALNANADPSIASNWIDCGSYAASVISVNGATGAITIDLASLNGVPKTTTVNGKALSGNITLTLGDLITFNNDSTYYLSGKGILEKLPSSAGTMVEDTLTSTSITNALSANQGRILNEKLNSPLYYLNAKPTSITTANTNIPLTILNSNMTYSSSYITLKAGISYDLEASLTYRACTWATYGWFDSNGVQLNDSNLGASGALNSSDQIAPSPAYASITPISDMQVCLRLVSISGSTVDLSNSYVKVRQRPSNVTIGKIDTTAVLYQDWQTWTPTIVADTNPVFTNSVFNCWYKVHGKSCILNFNLKGSNTGAYGSGIYRIKMPSGVKIDTTKVNLVTTANFWDSTCFCMTFASLDGGSNSFVTYIYPYSDSELLVRFNGSGGNWWQSTVHGVALHIGFITCEIPIL